jgi:ABC-type cobalt transport system substrate-binding protein
VKRILMILVVALIMAAMLVVMAAPAFANHGGHGNGSKVVSRLVVSQV